MRLLSRLLTGATKFNETGNRLPMIFDHRACKEIVDNRLPLSIPCISARPDLTFEQ
jgi:hypothetical protein